MGMCGRENEMSSGNYAPGAGTRQQIIANMPYMGRMRDGVSEGTPFIAMSHNTIYRHMWMVKWKNFSNHVRYGWGKIGRPSKYGKIKRVGQQQRPLQSYMIDHVILELL